MHSCFWGGMFTCQTHNWKIVKPCSTAIATRFTWHHLYTQLRNFHIWRFTIWWRDLHLDGSMYNLGSWTLLCHLQQLICSCSQVSQFQIQIWKMLLPTFYGICEALSEGHTLEWDWKLRWPFEAISALWLLPRLCCEISDCIAQIPNSQIVLWKFPNPRLHLEKLQIALWSWNCRSVCHPPLHTHERWRNYCMAVSEC